MGTSQYHHESSEGYGITFSGPGRKELPTLIGLCQLNQLGMLIFEHTEGINSSEYINEKIDGFCGTS